MENSTELIHALSIRLAELTARYGPKLLLAVLTLFIGLWLLKRVNKLILKSFERANMAPSLSSFLRNLLVNLLKVLLGLTVLSMFGIEMTSFIALLGAAGLAVGLALSGTLQNFAGGVIILLLKPFKVGDFIEASDYTGTVKEIQIFVTILNTTDNKRIILANGALANSNLTNFSAEPLRRVDWSIGIAYGDNYDAAKALIQRFIDEDDKILKDPAPFIALGALADSSVNITVRAWVDAPNYWDVFFKMNERVYKEFGENNLNIPFPQMDVHLHNS